MIWHILRYWTSLLLPVFYKRIQSKNAETLKVKAPVIIAMNHPNAFMDPVAFTAVCFPPRLKYMARGDAFKPGPITWLLEQIGIVPIFRIQDGGREGLKKNDDAYRRVNAFLKRRAKVIIFAEGICIQERRLRPLKKGLARMVFGAYEHLGTDELLVVPVGVNYSWPSKFRSNIFYNVGEPIRIKDFIDDYHQNPARAQNALLAHLEPKMKELITHINDPANDEAVFMVEQLCKKDWVKEQRLNYRNLNDQFTVQKHITSLVNKAAEEANPALEEFKAAGKNYFNALHANKLRDWLINPKQNRNVSWAMVFARCVMLLTGLPLHLAGLAGNALPLIVTDKLTRKVVKKPEFYASVALGVGMFVFLINYLIWFFVTYTLATSIFYPLAVCFGLMLCGAFSLVYHPFMLRTQGMIRILKKRELAATLAKQREILLSLVNKF